MRIHIKQCSYCPLKNDCRHKKLLREAFNNKLKGLHFVHNCPEYKKIFQKYDKVEIDVKHWGCGERYSHGDGAYDPPDYYQEWEDYEGNPVKGIIAGHITRWGGYLIKLDESIELNRIENYKNITQTFTHYTKRANEITLINREAPIKVPF